VKTPATTLTKTAFPQINCNVKERLVTPVRKRACDVTEKRHFIQKVFCADLNEIKYDYVDSKQHFYLQYHVAATDMKPLCKRRESTLQKT